MNTFRPRPAVRDRVVTIEVVQNVGGEATIWPSSSVVLGVQIRGRVRGEDGLLSTAGVTGIQGTARTYAYAAETTSLLVRFTPQGAACLGVPASELASRSIGLDEILSPAQVRLLRERLLHLRTPAEQAGLIEAFLSALPFSEDPLLARALSLLSSSSGSGSTVGAVARSLGLSERQLERRFLQRVGITPKRFATLRRFERAVELARTAPSLTAAALDAGYYDQSHFIRDFRRFTGAPPGELLRSHAGDVGFVQSPPGTAMQDERRRRT